MAARLTEALVKLHGVVGIRDGFQLFRMMIEQCWDRMNPVIETEDDLDVPPAHSTGSMTRIEVLGSPRACEWFH